jgi:hypothetical protein
MGGSGSGRWGSRRPLAEALQRIDIAHLRRDHPIIPGALVTMRYQWANGRRVETTVSFLFTPGRFGGRRVWFCCQILYGSWRIACHRCHRLRYLSQRES